MEWIDVNERLPEETNDEQIVIVTGFDDYGKRYTYWAQVYAYGKDQEVFSVPGWSQMNVTHWMPLPEPPKKFDAIINASDEDIINTHIREVNESRND